MLRVCCVRIAVTSHVLLVSYNMTLEDKPRSLEQIFEWQEWNGICM